MASRYIEFDFSNLREFVDRLGAAGKTDFKRELVTFMEAIGDDFLRIIEDEIIRLESVDTRLLLNSFQKESSGSNGNVYVMNEGDLTLEVGTVVSYASFVNDGHWTNPKGVETRWIPGYWSGDHFIYSPGAKTGMLLRQKWIEGSHYFDSAVRILEQMLPQILERKSQQWLDSYFAEFL